MKSVSNEAVDRLVSMLRLAIDEPDRQPEIGQLAAKLWWELDDAGHCGKAIPEIWEEALLGLATWHTGDNRLRLQGASETDIHRYLKALG